MCYLGFYNQTRKYIGYFVEFNPDKLEIERFISTDFCVNQMERVKNDFILLGEGNTL